MPVAVQNRRGEIEALAERYRLRLPERHRAALAGELQGRRAGGSIEFQDRKDYHPGDDPRAIDWRAYARNDRLSIKLYREEITPRVDLIVDVSASMSLDEAKVARRNELALLFYLLAARLQASIRLWALGRRMTRLGDPRELETFDHPRQDDPMPLLTASDAVRGGGIKILISDLLFPFDPVALAGAFPSADRLIAVQALSAFEHDPPEGGILRLQDAETMEYLDIALDKPTVRDYKMRLERLREDLDRRLTVNGGVFAVVHDGMDPDGVARALLEAGVIEV